MREIHLYFLQKTKVWKELSFVSCSCVAVMSGCFLLNQRLFFNTALYKEMKMTSSPPPFNLQSIALSKRSSVRPFITLSLFLQYIYIFFFGGERGGVRAYGCHVQCAQLRSIKTQSIYLSIPLSVNLLMSLHNYMFYVSINGIHIFSNLSF